MKAVYCIILVSVVLVVPFSASAGNIPNGFVIDQRCDETTGNSIAMWHNMQYYAPLGQTFIPSEGKNGKLQKLVGIEIILSGSPLLGAPAQTAFTMEIFDTAGNLVASQDFNTVGRWDGWYFVRFDKPVLLTPGQTYAFVVWVKPGQKGCWGLYSDGLWLVDSYPYGCWIFRGQWMDHNDLAFRTYILKSSR